MRLSALLLVGITALITAAPNALAVSKDIERLRTYFENPKAHPKLRRILVRKSVRNMLALMRRVEPHVRARRGMQTFKTRVGSYVVIPPKGYRPSISWPLHIELHGHGSTQTGKVACKRYWRGEPAEAGVILACPSLGGKWNSTRGEALLLATYKDVQQHFNVKTTRISLGGFSGGGIGTWLYGPRYPDLFSAIVARAGIPPLSSKVIKNLNGMPIYFVHGRNDPTIPVKHSRRIAKQLRQLKIDHIYKEMTGVHEFFRKLSKPILRWLSKKRRRLKARFRYHGRLGRTPRIIHWLHVEGSGKHTINGRIVRRRSVIINIDHPEKIKAINIYLSRKNFDVNRRRVNVTINGRHFTFPVRENAAAILDSYDITRDLRRVFTAKITVAGKRLR
jgi:pimeloyl-ACP methyl ester carboxylesterase